MNHAAILSFACGFASLSLEILWVRLYGFAKSSTPAAFGFVLCLYLLGIAFGAHFGARKCRSAGADAQALWRSALGTLAGSALLSVVLPAAYALTVIRGAAHPLIDAAAIASTSAAISYLFPIAHHLGTPPDQPGRHFARVYTSNVLGAALGPLVTGYVLLDALPVQQAFIVIGLLQLASAAWLASRLHLLGDMRVRAMGAGIATVLAALLAVDPHALVRHMNHDHPPARDVVENRHGIITIFGGEHGDDIVYGGNVYDGRTNLDPARNSNGLERPLLAAALQPAPRRVLMVGLSIGTWLAIVREFPGVETIDAIEINPGYVEAARMYRTHAAALHDPRVNLVVDDARRWLRRHPERRYDLVVMNNTYHWRSNASLLLSREWFELLRSHMTPSAVLAFNATGSLDAFATAAEVFPHALRFRNFIYASASDFRARKDSPRALATFAALQLQGRPFFPPGSHVAKGLVAEPFHTLEADRARAGRAGEGVTDDNMVTEFRRGRTLYEWNILDLVFGP